MKRICNECGKEFNIKPSAVKKGRGKYCSLRCRRGMNPIHIEGSTVYIGLLNKDGEVIAQALIDRADVDKVLAFEHRWYATWHKSTQQYFAQANIKGSNGKWTRISLHSFIVDVPDGYDVDHINHNMLDNRKANLRICTRSQNLQNRKGAQSNNLSSGIRGVSWDHSRRKWLAHVTVMGKQIFLGRHDNIADAEMAAINGRRKYMTHSSEVMPDA
jgi:hypothetical protein